MKEKIAALSVLANIGLAAGKIIVGVIAGATSVLAEGIHSAMDVLSSAVSWIGIRFAKRPIDEKHPYGHYKIEVVSGLVITLLLLGTGVWIIYEAYEGFIEPSKIEMSVLAIGVMLISAIVNEVMARLKIHYGKKENAIGLLSDGVHSRVDVWTSLVVLVGLFFTQYWVYTDSVLAFLIGLYIIKESISLGKEATDSLLDVSADKETVDKIREVAKEQDIKISDLKTQKKGSVITANIEVALPKDISVKEATEITNKLRQELLEKVDPLEYVAIQITSHDFTNTYFRPTDSIGRLGFGRGFGWQRKGRFQKKLSKAKAKGPGGMCICPKCGHEEPHVRGHPCAEKKCPECGEYMERKE